MKWIEWIRLQTVGFSDETLQYVTGLVQSIRDTPCLASVEIYSHAVIKGEIAFLLFWEAGPPQSKGSLVGLQLARELKTMGWVSHAVWLGI